MEWYKTFQPHISLTHITRSDKGSLSPRTFKHSDLLHKTMYLVLNFKSNLGTYEHDLLAYVHMNTCGRVATGSHVTVWVTAAAPRLFIQLFIDKQLSISIHYTNYTHIIHLSCILEMFKPVTPTHPPSPTTTVSSQFQFFAVPEMHAIHTFYSLWLL